MTLNVVQICQVKYPDEVRRMKITFRKPDFDILIDRWEVEGVERPKESDLLAEGDQYEQAYNLMRFREIGQVLVQNHIDEVAKTRQYNTGISCVSYAQSTNPVWAAEAQAFIAWRDEIFSYAIKIFLDIQEGQPAPTQEEFIAGFPKIVWPS